MGPPVGLAVAELDTPALLVDLDAFERNLTRMADWSRQIGCRVRPHVKSHKTPVVARRQIELGAIGVTCATLGEAEAMVAGGIDHILVSSEIVGTIKIARLIAIASRADVMVVVDDPTNARALSAAATAFGIRLATLVEVHIGQERCGVAPGEPAADLAALVAGLPGLRFAGLQGYEGHLQHLYDLAERRARHAEAIQRLIGTRRAVESRGLPVDIVSTAGTGTFALAGTYPGVTEVQPGSYLFMDADYLAVAGLQFESALSVLAGVVSRQRPGVAIIDAGWKWVSTDAGPPVVKGRADLTYSPAGDEHGRLIAADPNALPALGDKVEILPSHCDTTVNLHDQFIAVRNGRVAAIWPITARGRVQ